MVSVQNYLLNNPDYSPRNLVVIKANLKMRMKRTKCEVRLRCWIRSLKLYTKSSKMRILQLINDLDLEI